MSTELDLAPPLATKRLLFPLLQADEAAAAAAKESFRANIADGVGADLPAILGSTSMREKHAVLILRAGQELLAVPGAGGYKTEWSPGTKLFPLAYAPPNHLVIPCDHFSGLPTGTATEPELSFVTDHTIRPVPR